MVKLINDKYDGVTNRLAVDLGVKHHVISRCLGEKASRSLGNDLIRKIEAVCGLPQGALDEPDEDAIDYANHLAERMDKLKPEYRDKLLDFLELLERQ